MELKAKDTYKVEMNFELSQTLIQSLVVGYQALMGPIATSLYFTLYQEGRVSHSYDSHSRLCSLMGIDIVALETARKKCEELRLIQTWLNSSEAKDSYIYVLQAPLSIENFLSHDVLGRRYLQIVGAKNAEITQSRASNFSFDKAGFENISKPFNTESLETWSKDDEIKFNKVKPVYTMKSPIQKYIDFDYDSFLAQTTNLTFPIEARTPETLKLIGELATLYGIDVNRMRILVGHSINNSTNILNVQKLRNLASYEKPKEKKSKNPYDVSPIQFLQTCQNGIPVTPADARLLQYLLSELQMSQEVINVLIEAVLKQNNNRLSSSYVEKIAGTWVRNGIDSLVKAQAATKEMNAPVRKTSPASRVAVLPKDFEENKKAVGEKKEEKKLSELELEELRTQLKRLEE